MNKTHICYTVEYDQEHRMAGIREHTVIETTLPPSGLTAWLKFEDPDKIFWGYHTEDTQLFLDPESDAMTTRFGPVCLTQSDAAAYAVQHCALRKSKAAADLEALETELRILMRLDLLATFSEPSPQ